MTSFEKLYDQFLSTVSSYTLTQLTNDDIQAELFNLVERSIAAFKFPKISLAYTLNEDDYVHYFTETLTQKEINVILAYMKLFWVEYQISNEQRFLTQYYDDKVRTFSQGNVMAQLNRLHENFIENAKRTEYEYGRVAQDGRPNIGKLNV